MVKETPEARALRWEQVRGSKYRKVHQMEGKGEGWRKREQVGPSGPFIPTVIIINKGYSYE